MVDSGATHHITPHRSDFATWAPARGSVSLGGHAEIAQIGTGTVKIRPSGGDRDVHLQDVMHVPDAEACYFSVSALLSKCYRPSMRLNCYGLVSGVGALRTGFVSHMTRASCMSLVSAKALEPSPLVSLLVIGLCSRVSGWQSYLVLGVSRSVIVSTVSTLPSPCILGQQVNALLSV